MATSKQTSNASRRPARRAPEMKPEYDFSAGIRGKHAARYPKMKLKVMLDPDVAAVFPTSAAVNAALRPLARSKSKARTNPTPRRRKAS